MINLRYEIRICHKIYNRVTMTVCVKCVVWFNLNKTLVCFSLDSILNFMNAFLFNYQCFHNKRKYAKSGIVPFKHMTFFDFNIWKRCTVARLHFSWQKLYTKGGPNHMLLWGNCFFPEPYLRKSELEAILVKSSIKIWHLYQT